MSALAHQQQHRPPPVLVPELYAEILRHHWQALGELWRPLDRDLGVMSRGRWAEFAACCLVSRAWREEGQKILFRSISTLYFDLARKLEQCPALGRHVRHVELDIDSTNDATEEALFRSLPLLPNLEALDGLQRLTYFHTPKCPIDRPAALCSLGLHLERYADIRPPGSAARETSHPPLCAALDVSSRLRSLAFSAEWNVDVFRLLDEASSGLTALAIMGLNTEHLARFYTSDSSGLGRFGSLRSLKLDLRGPLPSAARPAFPFELVRDLEQLLLPLELSPGALVGTHKKLTTLVLGHMAFERRSAALGLRVLDQAYSVLSASPSPFPSLRTVKLGAYEGDDYSFISPPTAEAFECRLVEAADKLRQVGIELVVFQGYDIEWD